MKKSLSLLLAVIMIAMTFTVFPITANAVDVDAAGTAVDKTFTIETADDLSAAEAEINSATEPSNYVIELDADIVNGYFGSTNSNAVVTIFGNGHTIDRSEYGHTAVNVLNGATLNLGSPDGGEKNALTIVSGVDNDDAGIVHVWDGSICNMYNNVTLKDHKGQNYLGGGVTVNGGTFHMYGGTIQNCGIDGGSVCYGGGVAVINDGKFFMDNGTITDCYVKTNYNPTTDGVPYFITDPENLISATGGGVFVSSGSTFTMNGGTISKNKAHNSAINTAYGGGVAMVASDGDSGYTERYSFDGAMHSTVTINDGTITENSANKGAGIFASEQHYAYAGPIGKNNYRLILKSNPGLFINGGEISKNTALEEGGGVYLESIIDASEKNGLHRARVNLSGATIIRNTSGARGAGVYYDEIVKLWLSGANIIQGNTYNDKLNNLNIYKADDTVYPVYVDGDLTGSQIGLSDPKLWDDGLEDEADEAVSEEYLTSGFKTYNNGHPANYFTSDHETWSADFSDINANEVRLTRGAVVDYYINNNDISEATYEGKDLFTKYVTELAHKVRVGDKIEAFYAIPQHDTNYIFKGWYYDRENNNDSRPVQFGKDKYLPNKNIYAHWIKVEDVAQDAEDTYGLPAGYNGKYGGFDLAGVQIRKEMFDRNFDKITPGGMRFITTLSKNVVNEINTIQPNNIEYGYVAATHKDWIDYHKKALYGDEKLQYVSTTANGIDTSSANATDENYFGFAKNVNCTSKQTNKNGVVRLDHKNYGEYLIYSLVITYEEEGSDKGKNVLARPYIKYTDANGLERVAYSDYRGVSNTIGSCYTSYKYVAEKMAPSGN